MARRCIRLSQAQEQKKLVVAGIREKLGENLQVLMDAINKAKPAAAKGTYVRSVYLSATMGPAIKVNPLKF